MICLGKKRFVVKGAHPSVAEKRRFHSRFSTNPLVWATLVDWLPLATLLDYELTREESLMARSGSGRECREENPALIKHLEK